MSKNDSSRLIDFAYGRGLIDMFDWYDLKDRYELPERETNKYYRTCLYPLLGKRSYHLGKFELWYAHKCMLKGWTKAIESFRLAIEKREKEERFQKLKDKMVESFMKW